MQCVGEEVAECNVGNCGGVACEGAAVRRDEGSGKRDEVEKHGKKAGKLDEGAGGLWKGA